MIWKITVEWSSTMRCYFARARPKTFRGWLDSLRITPQHRLLGSGSTAEEALALVKDRIRDHAPITGTGRFTYDPDAE